MTKLFHLAYLGRKVNLSNGVYVFTDDLPEPTEQELADTYDEALRQWNAKSWENNEDFLNEFTFEEMANISLSDDPIISSLRFLLSCWRSIIVSTDPRVIGGLNRLVELGIITEERKQEIIN